VLLPQPETLGCLSDPVAFKYSHGCRLEVIVGLVECIKQVRMHTRLSAELDRKHCPARSLLLYSATHCRARESSPSDLRCPFTAVRTTFLWSDCPLTAARMVPLESRARSLPRAHISSRLGVWSLPHAHLSSRLASIHCHAQTLSSRPSCHSLPHADFFSSDPTSRCRTDIAPFATQSDPATHCRTHACTLVPTPIRCRTHPFPPVSPTSQCRAKLYFIHHLHRT